MSDKIKEDVGNAKVTYTGNSLYLLGSGGDFTLGKIKGSFGAGMGGNHLVVYIQNEGTEMSSSYQLDVKDMIETCITHHNKLKKGG